HVVRAPARREVACGYPGLLQSPRDDLVHALDDLHRIVLDPAGLREDLFVLLLIDADDGARMIEDHEPRARGSLVDGAYVVRHRPPPSFVGGRPQAPVSDSAAVRINIHDEVAPGS